MHAPRALILHVHESWGYRLLLFVTIVCSLVDVGTLAARPCRCVVVDVDADLVIVAAATYRLHLLHDVHVCSRLGGAPCIRRYNNNISVPRELPSRCSEKIRFPTDYDAR